MGWSLDSRISALASSAPWNLNLKPCTLHKGYLGSPQSFGETAASSAGQGHTGSGLLFFCWDCPATKIFHRGSVLAAGAFSTCSHKLSRPQRPGEEQWQITRIGSSRKWGKSLYKANGKGNPPLTQIGPAFESEAVIRCTGGGRTWSFS